MLFDSKSQVYELKNKMNESAERTYDKLKIMMESSTPLEILFQMKFNKIGFDPVDGDELNIIEQINQLFSDLVVMAALEELFDIYPSKKFETHMGAEAGFDIESTDGEVVAECFAVTTAASNGKLKKDSEKLINKASKQKKYIYFYSQNDIDEKLERIYEKFPEINYRRIKNIS